MTPEQISTLLARQKEFYHSGTTLSLAFRKAQLKKLYAAIRKYEPEILLALQKDLGKSPTEAFMCESGLALTEITHMLRHLDHYSKRKYVPTPLSQFPSRSYIQPMPYGNVLIMSPWNYPFLLTIEPLTDAIAAGNTAIVKPSAYSPATSQIVATILSECFPPEYIAVVTGGREENTALLQQKFDLIFFTGSQAVGKEILRHAAEHLTPAILELGGKSPCIVDETADLKLAAKRIVFGKFLNCGQTCVAPDHILCHRSVKDKLIQYLTEEIRSQFGATPLTNKDYGRIISQKHYLRLLNLIDPQKVVFGGNYDPSTLTIEPTVLDNITYDDSVMGEEIFGPLLPVLTYEDFSDLIRDLQSKNKPLALYFFSSRKDRIHHVTTRLSYGGGCINDVIIHLASSSLPFGGVGESGMGAYHGKAGFDAFTHHKSMVDKKTWLDLPMRYQPYTNTFFKNLIRLFLK